MSEVTSADATAAPPEDTRRVLLIDDSRPSRDLLSSMLRQVCAAEMLEASDGPGALGILRAKPCHLVFLDIEMPGMDGLAVLQEVRTLEPMPFVVLVTAHASAGNVRQALALGARGFVVKPYSTQRIIDVLRRYLTETGDKALMRAAR